MITDVLTSLARNKSLDVFTSDFARDTAFVLNQMFEDSPFSFSFNVCDNGTLNLEIMLIPSMISIIPSNASCQFDVNQYYDAIVNHGVSYTDSLHYFIKDQIEYLNNYVSLLGVTSL